MTNNTLNTQQNTQSYKYIHTNIHMSCKTFGFLGEITNIPSQVDIFMHKHINSYHFHFQESKPKVSSLSFFPSHDQEPKTSRRSISFQVSSEILLLVNFYL